MSGYSEDDVRRAAELREWVMKQISDKQEELERLRATLAIIDSVLKQGSFRAAAVMATSSAATTTSEPARPPQQQAAAPPAPQAKKSTTTIAASAPQPAKQAAAAAAGFDPGRDVRPLKRAKDDFLLANAEVTANSITIVPAPGVSLSVNTPPFRSFFLGRILDGMKSKDADRVAQGALAESGVMSYKVDEDAGMMIKKITITNYREKERMTEIFNTAAWVFTRMLEKAGS
ncbi:hypothetical protein [Nitrososphaera viennensis]|nr:hypothetical protein [Nitrososphaera viennensis]UVS68519.1 hypothetical protein NWT39_11480 [Nitrososphaera viennensis]